MITLEPVRADTLPENTNYRDDGCVISSTCLDCPLPVCKFDAPGWLQRASRYDRDVEVVKMRFRDGLSVEEIAERFELSGRTIHRILQSDRNGSLEEQSAVPESPTERLRDRRYFKLHAPFPPVRSGIIVEFEAVAGF
ncbi:MAG: hypothetical protein HQ478_01720 [Chloroflexi bacterium]|nr:hypothetical protein [Chloroflexota bacterium]